MTENVREVCQSVARYLSNTCHRATIRPRPPTRFSVEDQEAEDEANNPTRLLGLPSEQQVELMARLLPSSLDILFVGLELERWTSIVAAAANFCKTFLWNFLLNLNLV